MAKDWVALEALFPTKKQQQQPSGDGVADIQAPKNAFFNKVKSLVKESVYVQVDIIIDRSVFLGASLTSIVLCVLSDHDRNLHNV